MSSFETEYTSEIVCPYCGYEYEDSWEFEPDVSTLDCERCGKTFRYERVVTSTVRSGTVRRTENSTSSNPAVRTVFGAASAVSGE